MLKNLVKIALRNFRRNKMFAIINILGLAVGITCFIAFTLFVKDELGYDTFNEKANNIYRVYVDSNVGGKTSVNSKTAAAVGQMLEDNLPEVISYTRIGYPGHFDLSYADKLLNESHIYTADSTFLGIFTYPLIDGDPKTALVKPNSIVLTETISKKYFGNDNPVGKTFSVNGTDTYLVTGLMKDFPDKSHFRCDALVSMTSFPPKQNEYVINLWYSTYVLLKDGTDYKQFEEKIKNVAKNYIDPEVRKILGVSMEEFSKNGSWYNYRLEPLTSIYLYSSRDFGIDPNTEWSDEKSGDIAYVHIFSIIAVFILLIAVFNFINLSTARSEKKAKEVGIRKTLGSNRKQLALQFFTEAVIMCFIAVLFAIIFLQFFLPVFNAFVGRNLSLGLFDNFYAIPALILFSLIVGVLSGSYPAFYMSSLQPAQIIKPNREKSKWKRSFMSAMVIIQFAISIMLIIGTILIKDQLNYLQNKNLGFKKDYLLSINCSNSQIFKNRIELFKNELLNNPKITSVTNSSLLFRGGIAGSGYYYDKNFGSDLVLAQYLDVDYDFLKTFNIELKEGRFFSKEYSTDSNAVLINETAMKQFNATDPVGKILTSVPDGSRKLSYHIIGVIKDFNYESLHKTVRPLVLYLGPVKQASSMITMRVSSNNLNSTIDYVKDKWNKFTEDQYFSFSFIDKKIAELYSREENMGDIVTIFSALAIFIACLGLFGLAAFVTERRIKEIGIRKVLGASTTRIVYLLSKEFSIWVLMANIIAFPVAYLFIENWLQDFAYRIDINIGVFLLSGLIALAIAIATVSSLTVKAATANPVESLRNE